MCVFIYCMRVHEQQPKKIRIHWFCIFSSRTWFFSIHSSEIDVEIFIIQEWIKKRNRMREWVKLQREKKTHHSQSGLFVCMFIANIWKIIYMWWIGILYVYNTVDAIQIFMQNYSGLCGKIGNCKCCTLYIILSFNDCVQLITSVFFFNGILNRKIHTRNPFEINLKSIGPWDDCLWLSSWTHSFDEPMASLSPSPSLNLQSRDALRFWHFSMLNNKNWQIWKIWKRFKECS